MRVTTHWPRRAVALGLTTALAAALAGAQDAPGGRPPAGRYDLRASYPYRVGDRVRVVHGTRHEGLATVMQRGKPLRVENKRGGFELRYTEEVQGLGPGGGVVRVLRTYERVKDWSTGQEDRRRRQVLLDYSGETMRFTAKEELPEVASDLLEGASKVPLSAYQHLFPTEHAVPVGHRWSIPNAPAAQIFRLDPAAILEESSSCHGKLEATRQHEGAEQVRVVLTFGLKFTRLFDEITFDRPAELECTYDTWEAAHGAVPSVSGTVSGSIRGEGRVEGAPKDVTVDVNVTVTGTYQVELLTTAR